MGVQHVAAQQPHKAKMYSVLVERGVKFNTTTPKASIATALGRLVQSGVLKMTFKGAGQVPNRFQKADLPVDDLL